MNFCGKLFKIALHENRIISEEQQMRKTSKARNLKTKIT